MSQWDYIVNPKTNRKCSIYSRNGQDILSKYVQQIGGLGSNTRMGVHELLTELDIENSSKELDRRMGRKNVRILLIRHAQSAMNTQPGIICGRSPRSMLTKRGLEQAHECGVRLNGEFPEGFTSVYSSPAVRTTATARAMLSKMSGDKGQNMQFDTRLSELSMGGWTGRLRSEVYTKDVVDKLDIFHRPPGVDEDGVAGESQIDVENRMVDFMNDVVSHHPDGSVVAVVSHGVAIKCFLRHILQMGPLANLHINLGNTSITEVEYKQVVGDKGGWHLNRLGA